MLFIGGKENIIDINKNTSIFYNQKDITQLQKKQGQKLSIRTQAKVVIRSQDLKVFKDQATSP